MTGRKILNILETLKPLESTKQPTNTGLTRETLFSRVLMEKREIESSLKCT